MTSPTKQQRRAERLAARQKVYTHLPPRSERATAADATPSRRRAIFIPVFGKTIHDPGMGATIIRRGMPNMAPSTHSKKRKRPAAMHRKHQQRRRRIELERSHAMRRVEAEMCAAGDHTLISSHVYPDGSPAVFYCTHGCGYTETV